MHQTASSKVRLFLEEHVINVSGTGQKTVLDVGACCYSKQETTGEIPQGSAVRGICEQAGAKYVGLDIVPGLNVDVVTKRPFVWNEIESESFDFVISTSTFEHNPFFWVTFAEIARVLKQGGKALVTAPGAGAVHRYPLDCWRFYPNSWAVLCALSGLSIDEVITEPKQSTGVLKGTGWWDSLVIASKQTFQNPQAADQFYSRLKPLVEPYAQFNADDVQPAPVNRGPLFRKYLNFVKRHAESQTRQAALARS